MRPDLSQSPNCGDDTVTERFARLATEPIELGGDPAQTTVRSHLDVRILTSNEIESLSALCPTSVEIADRVVHGRDWWPLSMAWSLANAVPQIPAVVCRPTSTDDVSALVRYCHSARIPVTASGGRSGVCGAAVPLHGGVALDMCAMQGVVSVDEVSGIIEVLPGTFGPDAEEAAREQGLTIGHFPQSFDISTVGGWVACRGAGQFSTRYGKIEDMVHGLEVVLADGSIITTGRTPAGATGPDLTQLFVGSEGTLGIITRIWLRAHPRAEVERHGAYVFPSFTDGVEAIRRMIRHGATPAVLRLYDAIESKRSHGGDGASCTLLVLDEGHETLVDATMSVVHNICLEMGASVGDEHLVHHWLQHRNNTDGLQALTRKGFIVDTMEVAAPWSQIEHVYENVTSAVGALTHTRSVSCHLSHSYIDGACLYFTMAGTPLDSDIDTSYRLMWDTAQRAALRAGANLSHHHGVGLHRARYMREAFGESMRVLDSVKASLDPHNILNPGKLGFANF